MKNSIKAHLLLTLCSFSGLMSSQENKAQNEENAQLQAALKASQEEAEKARQQEEQEFQAQLAQALRESSQSSSSSRASSPRSYQEEDAHFKAALKASQEEAEKARQQEEQEVQEAIRLAQKQKEKDEKLAQEQWDKFLKTILERSQQEEQARQAAAKQEIDDLEKALAESETFYREKQQKKYSNLGGYAKKLHTFNVDALKIPSSDTPTNTVYIPVMQQIYNNCMWHALINALVIMKKLQNQDFTATPAYETLLNICSSANIATLNASFDKFYEAFTADHAPDLQETIAVSSDLIFASEKDQRQQHADGITALEKITSKILTHLNDDNYFLPILINNAELHKPGGDNCNHWYLLLIHIRNSQIQYYVADSLGIDRSNAQPVENLVNQISQILN